ncbi:hypothetical protein NQ314_006845 [Rhamnusium bicolor]|uniref:RING-type E3 ubiquitin transferase n=1 Tax=Rhamnusium bicolor TaxID=1586634 RepID=A0AAV8YY04_9CUCU|nr:hypothetical protein NQ314_006845 [Rhamnusium bicolor]
MQKFTSMSFVQTESLPNLKCTNCKKYLSHFPIYFNPQGGSFCGRCPISNDGNNMRNEIYENLARTLKFPCCFDTNGCIEVVTPDKIPQHEEFCNFKNYECPMSCFTNCEWKGTVKRLLDHFEQKHPTFILRDGQFELDFINSHKENYLLPFGEDLYVVSRMNDFKTNTFSCTVSYIGSNARAENYVYKIVLESGNKSQVYMIKNKLKTTTEIQGENIRKILNDPTSIIARIEIMESGDDTVENVIIVAKEVKEEEEYVNSELNYDMLSGLECVVCMEYMIPPIHQCITGHSICFHCKTKVAQCPTCRKEFQNTQNFALAQIIYHLTYPCKHSKCRFTAKARYIRQHEESCVYGPFKCPLQEYENCNVQLIFSDVLDHVMNTHYEHVLEMDTVTLPFDNANEDDDEDKDCYILKYSFKLFKLHFLYRYHTFYWAMQLIGPADESTKYKFEIDIIDNSGKNHRAYFRTSCSPLSDDADAFSDGKSYIYLHLDQIRTMFTNDLCYRVRILQ